MPTYGNMLGLHPATTPSITAPAGLDLVWEEAVTVDKDAMLEAGLDAAPLGLEAGVPCT